jgi:hypothetical protein
MNATKFIEDSTPIAMLTVGELRRVLEKAQPVEVKTEQSKQYVHGLKGIRELFNVSHATAQKYKDTILKEAVSQQGRVIITDVEKALELFNKKEGKL